MGDSHSWKPGTRPGGSPAPAKPTAASPKPAPAPGAKSPPTTGSPAGAGSAKAGRITHDERGNAVWNWLQDTARIAIDSTSRLLRKLEVPELKMEDTASQELRIESDRDQGGGYNPYGASGATPDRTTGGNVSNSSTRGGGATHSGGGTTNKTGGGYDPYGKGITNKPKR